MSAAPGWAVGVRRIEDLSTLESEWRELEGRADSSFFQSWGWIGTWLELLPPRRPPLLLEIRRDGEIVGLGALGQRKLFRRGIFSSRAMFVSEAGEPEPDAITVEHSGLLMQRGLEDTVLTHSLDHLAEAREPWDELYLSGVDREQAERYLRSAAGLGLTAEVRDEHPYFFVDLERLRREDRDYLAVLSANTRYQIRRALRAYRKRGEIELEAADTLARAHAFFAELREAHQRAWARRGKPGAFANPFVNRFHERLIERAFASGAIQLLRCRAGGRVFAHLYNYVWQGVVSNYQSGLVFEADNKIKPGLVAHALAVRLNTELGHRSYDLLVGDQRFKHSLSTGSGQMLWVVLQRGRLNLRLESGLRTLWRRLAGR